MAGGGDPVEARLGRRDEDLLGGKTGDSLACVTQDPLAQVTKVNTQAPLTSGAAQQGPQLILLEVGAALQDVQTPLCMPKAGVAAMLAQDSQPSLTVRATQGKHLTLESKVEAGSKAKN